MPKLLEQVWQANDGSVHESEEAATAHEEKLEDQKLRAVDRQDLASLIYENLNCYHSVGDIIQRREHRRDIARGFREITVVKEMERISYIRIGDGRLSAMAEQVAETLQKKGFRRPRKNKA